MPFPSCVTHHAHFVEFKRLASCLLTLERRPLLVPQQLHGLLLRGEAGQLGSLRLQLPMYAREFQHAPLGIEAVLQRRPGLQLHTPDIDPLPHPQRLGQRPTLVAHHLLTGPDTRFQCQTLAFKLGYDKHLIAFRAFTLIEHGLEFEHKSGHIGSRPLFR